jgi:25S rRNA (adenine2142-N1)-methyltransferase
MGVINVDVDTRPSLRSCQQPSLDLAHPSTRWPSIFFASRTMPKGSRRRKLPVTVAERHGSSSTPRTSRTVIRKFHTLLKQQKSAQGDTLTSVNHELEKLGGLEKYQHMSSIGQGTDRGGGSEKVLIGWVKQMGWADQKHRHVRFVYTEQYSTDLTPAGLDRYYTPLVFSPTRLLDVGAVKPDNYHSCASWIDATPIDLHSRHPSILEQDFLCMDQERHREAWDIISLSLVLNFVPDGKDRGTLPLATSRLGTAVAN